MSFLQPPPTRFHAMTAISIICSSLVWLALFALTPGLFKRGLGALLSSDIDLIVAAESALVIVIAGLLLIVFRSENAALFPRSRLLWVYALPVGAALVLPLFYGLPRPLPIYMFWMAASVFWQDYLTFGLLQNRLCRLLPRGATITAVAALFALAHVALIPDRFASPIPALAMLVLGFLLAVIRDRTQSLHVILALHLAFYFVFAF